MTYAVGSLVKTRGREWVVLPNSAENVLMLRPLGGTEQEVTGIFLPLEGNDVQAATFDYPDPAIPGDHRSCQILHDAVRLGFRSSAGPFRSFARINVEPRPYQLVPLLMALKQDPVRLLIADDVGIGKTVEAGLIARELLDRGEIKRIAVLCPPHLAEQWQTELADKFHIEAELVLSSTVSRLERNTAMGQSLFDVYPFVIVSTEYIKSSRRREEFVRACPEFVIVDEAHTCAFAGDGRGGGRQLRHQLLQALSSDGNRHLVLVTATPHSGKDSAFFSLLGLLRPEFLDYPADLSGEHNRKAREEIAKHLVQRRRADIRDYMGTDTIFPTREEKEVTYRLTPEYRQLFQTVLDYAREQVLDTSGGERRQRVRWWSVLALLRSLASSPAAAAATLRARSITADAETLEETNAVGERAILDLDDSETAEFLDVVAGAQAGEEEEAHNNRDRLLRYARRADDLYGIKADAKLKGAVAQVKALLNDGYNPILFCRFIPTANYVATELRKALPKRVEVVAVTGELPPAEREKRVSAMGDHTQRVLVATDCLSEGINLQEHFTAVIHYDLSWNPTRHEQREGRVDRYGQSHPTIRALTYYGTDNQIDGIVLDVLLRKHRSIRSSLGISVPMPANTSDVVKALMNGMILRGQQVPQQGTLFDLAGPEYQNLHRDWDNVTEREKRSRTLFAQRSIKVEDVAQEWEAVRSAIGTHQDVERFICDVVRAYPGGHVSQKPPVTTLNLPNDRVLRAMNHQEEKLKATFELPVPEGATYLGRTHPFVAQIATHTFNTALDPLHESVARRCGVIRTAQRSTPATLLLLRLRFHIITERDKEEIPLLAEDSLMVGFTGRPSTPNWLAEDEVEHLLTATPSANISTQDKTAFLERTISQLDSLQPHLRDVALAHGAELLAAHRRVRTAAAARGVRYRIEPQLPPDVLGVYILLPG